MKTAGRKNPNRWAKVAGNRAPGADVKNRSSSIKWAVKQEKLQPMRKCFFLTSLFIELTGTWETEPLAGVYTRWSGSTESVWPSTSCGSLGLLTSQNTI